MPFPKGGVAWNRGLTKEDPRVARYVNSHVGFQTSQGTKDKISFRLYEKVRLRLKAMEDYAIRNGFEFRIYYPTK